MKLPLIKYIEAVENLIILCVDGIILNDKGEFLLVKRKNKPLKNQYWVPGGRAHKGESMEQAFHRKMKEELGIKVKIMMPLGYYEEVYQDNPYNVKGGVHTISVVFSAVPLSKKIKLDDQSSAWKWSKKLPAKLKDIKPFNVYFK